MKQEGGPSYDWKEGSYFTDNTPLPFQVPSRHELPFVFPRFQDSSRLTGPRFLRPIWDHVCS
jgi:hypothetical protein